VSDVQSVRGGGIELITKFGSGTGWIRLGACSKEANNERAWVRNANFMGKYMYTVRTYETSMAERQYPQTPNLTTASMPEFMRVPSLALMLRSKRSRDLIIGTERETRRRRRVARKAAKTARRWGNIILVVVSVQEVSTVCARSTSALCSLHRLSRDVV